ncbi:MAG: sulfite oxidase-like oxidoreductase [Chloroflexota bacterium]
MSEENFIISPDTKRKERIPPGQKATEEWPVLQHGDIPHIDISEWKFTISGLVANEITMDYKEFSSLDRIKVFSDIHCVTTWSKMDNLWEGVSSGTIKDLAQILPEARFVIIHADGGFTTNLALDDFLETDVLYALKHNDETLTPEHGYPVRLVVPRLYFWKSAKWVTGVEFVAEDSPGFWENRGYHNRGDPWREERYS